MVTLKCIAIKYKVQSFEDVPLVELIYLVFIRTPGESYRR